jgi:tagatose-6-phosphate ketose/aldose isomerase
MMYLELDETQLTKRGALWTAREIEQQPRSWLRTQEMLGKRAGEIEAFLKPLLVRPDLRVILTGAGSSAYIGQCLAPWLLRTINIRVEAIATTELVSAPRDYLQQHVPTLLVSFGRSGNSPESVAAMKLAQAALDECHQLVFTCNPQGQLYKYCNELPNALAILLPEETHDRSFAMTSSFSGMLYAALAVFGGIQAPQLSIAGDAVIEKFNSSLRALASRQHARVVYLGSGALLGLANEAALKVLELTDGAAAAVAHSSLGLRHGPKTFINRDTLAVMFMSNDPLTRRYDLDLLSELRRDRVAASVLAISSREDAATQEGEHLLIPGMSAAADVEQMLPYVVCAQLYAFHRSLAMNNSPDNPNAQGIVSRVVQGVTIHNL